MSDHEVYEDNCGANIYLDSGSDKSRTVATFDHLTNLGAREADCKAPGPGVIIEAANNRTDRYAFTNAVFQDNANGRDFVTGCSEECKQTKVKVTVTRSTVQKEYVDGGIKVVFGEGIVQPPAGAAAPDAAVPAPEQSTAASPPEPPPAADDTHAESARSEPDVRGTTGAAGDISAKEAFAAAKELGTVEAWNGFLANYSTGFRADLARAYIKKLSASGLRQ